MTNESIKEKQARKVKEWGELELERLKREKHEKERLEAIKRSEDAKLQAQINYNKYTKEQQRKRDQEEFEKSPEGRRQRSFRDAQINKDRDIKMGLNEEQRAYKYMDAQTRIECNNAIAQGEVRDIMGFTKKKRLEQEASERNRRRLKGL